MPILFAKNPERGFWLVKFPDFRVGLHRVSSPYRKSTAPQRSLSYAKIWEFSQRPWFCTAFYYYRKSTAARSSSPRREI